MSTNPFRQFVIYVLIITAGMLTVTQASFAAHLKIHKKHRMHRNHGHKFFSSIEASILVRIPHADHDPTSIVADISKSGTKPFTVSPEKITLTVKLNAKVDKSVKNYAVYLISLAHEFDNTKDVNAYFEIPESDLRNNTNPIFLNWVKDNGNPPKDSSKVPIDSDGNIVIYIMPGTNIGTCALVLSQDPQIWKNLTDLAWYAVYDDVYGNERDVSSHPISIKVASIRPKSSKRKAAYGMSLTNKMPHTSSVQYKVPAVASHSRAVSSLTASLNAELYNIPVPHADHDPTSIVVANNAMTKTTISSGDTLTVTVNLHQPVATSDGIVPIKVRVVADEKLPDGNYGLAELHYDDLGDAFTNSFADDAGLPNAATISRDYDGNIVLYIQAQNGASQSSGTFQLTLNNTPSYWTNIAGLAFYASYLDTTNAYPGSAPNGIYRNASRLVASHLIKYQQAP